MNAAGTAALRVTHEHGRQVVVSVERADGTPRVDIATYAYDPQVPDVESRKPYLHPVRTLGGALVSAYRPHDHRWHKGVQMTVSHLSGQNFWGGDSYRHGQGYVPLDNVGRMRHERFDAMEVSDSRVRLVQALTWVTSTGQEWVAESRQLTVHGVDVERGTWVLDFATELVNIRGEDLQVGSPTTHGRPAAGYTGFFWRGPRGFTGGEVLTADGGGPEAMGRTSPWLAYTGQHDEVDGAATLVFLAGATSGSVPLRWFVRNDPFPAVNPSPAFSEEVTIPPGEALALRHRLVVVDRPWRREDIEAYLSENPL